MIIDLSTPKSVTIWLQERTVVRMTNMTSSVKLWSNLHGSAANPIATYTPDAAKVVLIDITDYLRAYRGSVTVCNFSYGSGSNIPLMTSIGGLINPASVSIPRHKLTGVADIVPPSYMISAEDFSKKISFEFRSSISWWVHEKNTVGGSNVKQITQPTTEFNFANIADYLIIDSDGDYPLDGVVTPMRCDVQYAFVKWRSFTGAWRAHVFEVVKNKTAQADAYSLLPTDNEYKTITGRVDSLALRLDNLNEYDLWYYADIITSSEVYVCINDVTGNEERVQVTTKDITYPDGNAGTDGKLEITVNYKRYDAVAM